MSKNTSFVNPEFNLHSYRFLGDEAEILGTRLDAARKSLAASKSAWAKKHWQGVVNQLVFQWRSLPALHDADARMSVVPRWAISYDWYTADHGADGYSITDKMFDQVFRTDLQACWDRAREARLARAQY